MSSVSGEIIKNHTGSYFVKALFQQSEGWKRISIFILNHKFFFQRQNIKQVKSTVIIIKII